MSRRAFDLDEPYTPRDATDPDPNGVLARRLPEHAERLDPEGDDS